MNSQGSFFRQMDNEDGDRFRHEAEAAVRTLIEWAGDDPEREGLLGTPERVVRAYEEFFAGYRVDPIAFMTKESVTASNDGQIVLYRNIRLESHCEHHMVPIIGRVHVGFIPTSRTAMVSTIARMVDAFGKRLQVQEALTAQMAEAVQIALSPKGVGVVVEAAHQCMTTRGVHKSGVSIMTSSLLGIFRADPTIRREFFSMVAAPGIGA